MNRLLNNTIINIKLKIMNKKFSTLVATLLVAGAGMTLNAEVVKVTTPKIGGSYLIATTVTPGVGDAGKVAGLLKINTKGDGVEATKTEAASYQAVGGEWTLKEISSDPGNFMLLKGGKCIVPDGENIILQDAAAAGRVISFVIKEGKLVSGTKGLSIANGAVTLVDKASATPVEFGTYQADPVKILDKEVKAVASPAKDTYYFIAAADKKLLSFANKDAAAVTVDDGEDIDLATVANYLWKVSETTVGGNTQCTFENKAFPGKYANIDKTTAFTVSGKYNSGVGLFVGANSVDADFTAGGDAATAIAFGFYEAPLFAYTEADLKAFLGGSFNLSIADADKTEGAELFDGDLVPVGVITPAPVAESGDVTVETSPEYYRLKKGDKYIVLNTKNIWAGNVGNETLKRGAKFELVDEKDIEKEDYLSYFQISRSVGNDASKDIKVEVLNADQSDVYGRLFAVAASDKKYLTTSNDKSDNETWLSVQIGASNIVDVKTLLGKYWNISYAASKETAKKEKEEYKLNGVVTPFMPSLLTYLYADYVDASTVLLTSPETQWAVVEADATTNKFTLKNRESDTRIAGVILRKTNTPNVYCVSTAPTASATSPVTFVNDTIKLTAVTKVTKYDGFKTSTPNALRNEAYNIGQYHNTTGNVSAYWVENHGANGTHQLGLATEGAVDWKLSLATKEGKEEVDTALVITRFAKWDGSKIVNNATPDTLAVLPFLFQNTSNLEYVKYKGDGFNYYVCDETPNQKDNGARFALKEKPNGFNIISMFDKGGEVMSSLGSYKINASNSVKWGALVDMKIYSKDENSIMVVTPVEKPEYRKVAKEWGDVVKIYRDEYPTEVLFEKNDSKSVVNGKSLSFLNVNNSVSGANPALFVDTAYVNRVDADGIKNTCYQYLLGVNVEKENTTVCPFDPEHNTEEWKAANGGPCPHAKANPEVVKGRFLINLVDTAFAYKQNNLHNNPYVNNVEANEDLAKLSFVEGYHSQDTLYITRQGGEVVKLPMDSSNFNVAKFAFRYVNSEKGSFKIQTQFKRYQSDLDQTKEELEESAKDTEGYLRWVNGTIVVTENYLNGETFNMEENFNGNPVNNEELEAATYSVVATDGAVIIKGASGKEVTISNVLGQTVANAVLSSDEATIAAPKGYVTVAVKGEQAVKAIVK